ncbi:PPPDE putative peptidase domain-containing protein [Massariosphaeria phaeospora]|uniref:PPPDE putative peptidase domain-containing protein n=1 Tax=Massariosphaeria phaeospora TaxID=100035 RepID=A0A7C8M640_9PLEO|nr:PPPDE putative peptidase domain-containing protein [Massariosphaeria phaeospora]
MSSSTRPKPSRKSSANHRSTLSLQRTEIKIHVYDLLPPGKVSTVLWAIGSSLLHSGVVINDREYAYGGHDQPMMTGVYWTKPRQEPPGGTFKHSVLQGFSFRPEEELQAIIHEASERFHGTSYNLLTKNCNHFTSYLCEKLTSRSAPGWLNRAASIGVALPCVVPREWIAPPDYDTADGELLDEDFDDERSSMLRHDQRLQKRTSEDDADDWDNDPLALSSSSGGSEQGSTGGPPRYTTTTYAPRLVAIKDLDSRELPPAERAPLSQRIT